MFNYFPNILIFMLFNLVTFSVHASNNQWQGVPLVEFNLANQDGEIKSNKDYLGQWLVLYFYPKDKTSGCTVEAQKFTDDYAQYQAINANIVGVSYDDVASHKDFAETYQMPFSLLADVDHQLSKALKVDRLFPWPHASRQTFVIDPNGIIVKHFKDVTPENHSSQLLKQLRQLQQSDNKALGQD